MVPWAKVSVVEVKKKKIRFSDILMEENETTFFWGGAGVGGNISKERSAILKTLILCHILNWPN